MLQKLIEGQKWQLVMNDDGETFLQLNCGRVLHSTHLSRDGRADWFYREMMEFMAIVKRENDNMLSSKTVNENTFMLTWGKEEHIMDEYEILGSVWFTTNRGSVGVVAVKTNTHEPKKIEWAAYVGIGLGQYLYHDNQYVARWGVKLIPSHAIGFFPKLSIDDYKRDEM